MIDLDKLNQIERFGDVAFCNHRVYHYYQDRWTDKGHGINSGMLSPDGKYFYVNISKNNSSFTKKVLEKLGWAFDTLEDYSGTPQQPTNIVVLRDPMSRWISGITEYMFLYHIDILDTFGLYSAEHGFQRLLAQPLAMSMIFDRVTFDDHTEKQCAFLFGIDLDDVVWFDAQDSYTEKLSEFLSSIGYSVDLSDLPPENADSDFESKYNFHSKRKAMKTFITEYMDTYPVYRDMVQKHFACDYHLMDCVKFYGS